MENRYENFSAVDFAKDEYFIQWRLLKDDESAAFWEAYVDIHPGQSAEIGKAIAIVDTAVISDRTYTTSEKKVAIERLEKRYARRDKRRRRILAYTASAAACAVLVLFATGLWPLNGSGEGDTIAGNQMIITEEIKLISGGEVITLSDKTEIVYNAFGKIDIGDGWGDIMDTVVDGDIVINKLIVPRGKRLSAILSDGSRVWINSGSSIEFPSLFDADRREIKVDGEIYIEVAKKADCPFFVTTDNLNIGVLGTTFNVSAYKDDGYESVVLIEGLVSVTTSSGESRRLSPNQMMTVSGSETSVHTVDVYDHISWKDGVLRFDGESLENILQKLSRYYAVGIEYGEGIGELKCSGKLVLTDNIEDALKSISVISPVSYRINNNKIEISMREKT